MQPDLDPQWLDIAGYEDAGSSLTDPKFDALHEALTRAVEAAPKACVRAVCSEAGRRMHRAALAYDALSTEKFLERVTERSSWPPYLERCAVALGALEAAHRFAPDDTSVLESAIELCERQLQGVTYPEFCDYWLFRDRRHAVSKAYAAVLRSKVAELTAALERARAEPPG